MPDFMALCRIRSVLSMIFVVGALVALSGCTEVQYLSHLSKQVNPPPQSKGTFKVGSSYKVGGKRYYPTESYDYVETGIASWYGPGFDGKKTANGEIFDEDELTAAHKTLQMPSLVRVTNLDNGRSLIVRVNDRGPYARGRIIDVSKRAAELLGFKNKGTAKVRLEVLPKESMQIAEAAKRGIDTSGYEVAVNQTGRMPGSYQVASAPPQRQPQTARNATNTMPTGYNSNTAMTSTYSPRQTASLQPVQQEKLTSPAQGSAMPLQNVTPGHMRNGNFYPDPVVTEMPVTKTSIYVQAGSFTVQSNAANLSRKLSAYAPADVYPAMVNGRQFYRVRLGPIETVDQADALLNRVVNAGHNEAIIVVQ